RSENRLPFVLRFDGGVPRIRFHPRGVVDRQTRVVTNARSASNGVVAVVDVFVQQIRPLAGDVVLGERASGRERQRGEEDDGDTIHHWPPKYAMKNTANDYRFTGTPYTSIRPTFTNPPHPWPLPGMRSAKPTSSTLLRSGCSTQRPTSGGFDRSAWTVVTVLISSFS